MKLPKTYLFGVLSLTLMFCSLGCGGSGDAEDLPENFGKVTGVVKMNGKPLEGAVVTFQSTKPKSGGAASGATDKEGKYTIRYTGGIMGAVVGENHVTITSSGPPISETGVIPEFNDPIPAKYNTGAQNNPEMKVEVKEGEENVFNFNIE